MNKKIFSVALASLVALSLCGCGNPGIKDFSISGENKAEGCCEYSVIDIEASTQIKPSIPREYYNYYDTKDDSKKYLAVKFNVKNLTGKTVGADEIMNAQYTIGDSKYQVASVVESADGSQLLDASDTKIQPDGEKRIIFISKVPSWCLENDISMELDIGGKRYRADFNLDDINNERKFENTGEEIDGEGISINFSSVKYVDDLTPEHEEYGEFKSFKPKDDRHVFVMAEGILKNNGSEAVKAAEALNVRTVYDKKYDSTKLMETDDGKDISYIDDFEIEPGEEQRIFYLMEVPVSCKDDDVYIEIDFLDEKYYIKVEK